MTGVRYSSNDLLDYLRALAVEMGRTPKQLDLQGRRPTVKTMRDRFGSFSKALEAAGLPFRRHTRLTGADKAAIVKAYRAPVRGNAAELALKYRVSRVRIGQIGRGEG